MVVSQGVVDPRRTVLAVALSLVMVVGMLAVGTAGGGAVLAVDGGEAPLQGADEADLERFLVEFEDPGFAVSAAAAGVDRDAVIDSRQTATRDVRAPFEAAVADLGAVRVDARFWLVNAVTVTVDTARFDPARLEAIPNVVDVGPVPTVRATGATGVAGPADVGPTQNATAVEPEAVSTAAGASWAVNRINGVAAWNRFGTRGGDVDVAVLDTGVDPNRPDLTVSKWAEFNSTGESVDSSPYDDDGHGTAAASAAVGGDEAGLALGVAPEATLFAGKVLSGDEGVGTAAQVVSGMEWAYGEGAEVISMSLGGGNAEVFVDAVRNAHAVGAVVVASIGNDAAGTSSSPGNTYDSVGVGAVTDLNDVAGFSGGETIDSSNYTAWTDGPPADWPSSYAVPSVTAPGTLVPLAVAGSDAIGLGSGTSFSAPYVSGVAALMLSENGGLSPADVKANLEASADHPSGSVGTRYGHGVVDALGALNAVGGSADNPRFDISVADVDDPVEPGGTATLTVAVENVGSTAGSTDAMIVEQGGYVDVASDVQLDPGQSTQVPLEWPAGSVEGTYSVPVLGVDDFDVTTVTVDSSAEPSSPEFAVSIADAETPVEVNGTVNVTAAVSNVGDGDGFTNVDLVVLEDGAAVDTVADLPVAAGTTETVELTWATQGYTAGEYTLEVRVDGDNASTAVTLEESPPSVSDYANDDGIVDATGLLEAISDWRNDEIGTQLLLEVIAAWRSDEPVT